MPAMRILSFLRVQCCRSLFSVGALLAAALLVAAPAAYAVVPSAAAPVLRMDGLGKGAVPLDGAWQFHLGDDPAWAQPAADDATGHNGWAQITADGPWGTQGHADYTGYAWYRRHIDITMAPGSPASLAMMIAAIDDIYELYWNGQSMGRFG
ncbi:MAG TPA: hypothetical protein VE291_13090, partial [Terracidiphilus sp.]|nr:hypothetical protein [Terracidiphilus sp.]